ncbi:MAG: nickel ABC transporter permease subunit NikB [Aminobacteriaceae bacterium]|uniref:nickel ABC transporter permease subunit NikB n=1 Tax=Aminivibrio sp. TaxID=1872489 RepID=UPI002A1C4B66|nr:nickel ABC transporter permease subunit NikB [Synergistaceae bacterium]MDD3390270.1 nickel ABC transporter permease subunit NikB [Synergistaceae bacterium]MDD4021788.1 nickel ABC transporter permease subunit NikB [Synergistaceae bacterium]MDD4612863.1 nickel ABC transporter permease subunit NikB [Synergistaceae bacterium]
MVRFIVKRILMLLPILILVSVVVFLILRMAKGDPAMAYLRMSNIPPTEQALVEARRELGLDKPIPVQYASWLSRAIRLDFGRSYVTGRPVLEEILHYLPATLILAGAGLLFTLLASIPLGVIAALGKDKWPDHVMRAFSFVGVSIPSFWLGFLLVYAFGVKLGWLPTMGRGGLLHMILPVVTLSFMSIAINVRFLRANLLENIRSRSALYARARGISERRIVWVHVMRNSMIPVVTAIGMHLGEMLGGAVLVENIFSWPGVGRFAVQAVFNRDYPVLQCFILMMTVIFVLCNLCVDILYAIIDPRIRLAGDRS